MHHDRDSVATVVQMQSAEEQSAAVDRSTKGLVSTFQVALPEGSVALTIRHRSITVEPPTSELFRLMGAAVWPAALGTVKLVTDDAKMRRAAAQGGRLLELGSGHGLGGLAAACLPGWKRILLTDKDVRLVELIDENCRANLGRLPPSAASALSAQHCVWAHVASEERLLQHESEGQGFDVIIAAGCTYSSCIIDSLFTTVRRLLAPHGIAYIVHQSRELQHLFTGVSVRQTLRAKPQGYYRGSKRSEHMQPASIEEAAARHSLLLSGSRVLAEEGGGEEWQAGICVLELVHRPLAAAAAANTTGPTSAPQRLADVQPAR